MRPRLWMFTLAVGTICVLQGPPVLAWDWVGSGGNDDFSTGANWNGGGAPDDGLSIYFTVPATGYSTCTFDAAYNWDYPGPTTITGESPTWFEFTISGQPWTPWCEQANPCVVFEDYSKLIVEDDVLIGSTAFDGKVRISLASGVTCDLNGTNVVDDGTVLSVVTAGTTFVEMASLRVSSQTHEEHISFTLGGSGKVDVTGRTYIHGVYDDNDTPYTVGFWVAAGEFSTGTLSLVGGDSTNRRVSLDIDQDVTVETSTDVGGVEGPGGIVNIDVANAKTLDAGTLVILGPSVLRVSSNGAAAIPGKLQTSQ